MTVTTHSKISALALVICLLGASFYMYEFLLQVSLGVMTNELMRDLSLNAAGLGLVSAFYYYAYMSMQIPAGLLHDKFGPRLMLTVAILICALGALCFSYSYNIWEASAGRFLMGIGSAFSFSGALMLISRWFSPQYFAVLSGFVQLMSSIGAIAGELPLAIAIHHWHWRPTMMYLFVIGVILAVLVFLIVRNFPRGYQATPIVNATPVKKPPLKTVFGRMESWWVAIYSFAIWAPIAAFAGLWGIPFIVASYHITTEAASLACAAIWIGIGIGSPLVGWISERIQHRCGVLSVCALIGVISSIALIYLDLSPFMLYFALFLFGCAGSGQSLAFSIVRDINHPQVIGAAIGLNNMATVAGGAILPPVIGLLLQTNWDGVVVNHTPVYNLSDYRIALCMIPICYVIALFASMKGMRETYCKQTYPV